jgi:hypothetical protein
MDPATRVRGHEAVGVARGGGVLSPKTPSAASEGGFRRKNAWQAGRGERPGRLEPVTARGSGRQPRGGCRSRPRAGLRLHPGVRHGAVRRRRCEWEQPHYFSWRPAWAGDAEWMFGKSRTRLALGLDKGFLMDVGPPRVADFRLRPPGEVTEARNLLRIRLTTALIELTFTGDGKGRACFRFRRAIQRRAIARVNSWDIGQFLPLDGKSPPHADMLMGGAGPEPWQSRRAGRTERGDGA